MDILNEVRRQLRENADEKARKSGQRFFKEPVRMYGMKTTVALSIRPGENAERMAEQGYEEINGNNLAARLAGGKSTSTGAALAVASDVLARPELFRELFGLLEHEEPLVRMRAAYALSKALGERPELLRPYKDRFIDRLADPANSHLCRACLLQALRALELTPDDTGLLKDMLLDFMHSESSIVKTFSLQLLFDFAEADPALRPEVMPLLWDALERGTPAMRARARKLLKKYGL